MTASAAAAGAWFSHQDRLYQPWSSQTYAGFNFDDIAFQTQLQRRSVRCTCPNCTNEMSGLPPIVGPDERGRKQHICHIPGCERLYGKASHLKTHLRWHTGERPFLCLTCGKRFSRSDELQRHGRTHTNYRPYACPICSKKFSRSDHLSKHKKTHFKDKKSKKSGGAATTAEAKDQMSNTANNVSTNANTTTNTPQSSVTIKQEKCQEATEKINTNKNTTTMLNLQTAISKPQAQISRVIQPNAQTQTQSAQQQQQQHLQLSHQQQQQQQQQQQTPPQQQQQHEGVGNQLHLKTEQPEMAPSYNPYSNLYHHQSSSIFHPLSTTGSYGGQQTSFDLWNSHHHHHHHHALQNHHNSHSHHAHHQSLINVPATNLSTSGVQQQQQQQHQSQPQQHQLQQQQQSTQQQQQQQQQSSSSSTSTSSYAALALQSETQLAAEFGLTMSSPSSNASNSNGGPGSSSSPVGNLNTNVTQTASSYTGLLGHMKSEYSNYADFSASGYASAGTSFHHHHHHPGGHHNPWAVYQHSHAAA